MLARAAELAPSILLDTADVYGPNTNEKLICEYCCIVQLFTCPPLMSLGTSKHTVIGSLLRGRPLLRRNRRNARRQPPLPGHVTCLPAKAYLMPQLEASVEPSCCHGGQCLLQAPGGDAVSLRPRCPKP